MKKRVVILSLILCITLLPSATALAAFPPADLRDHWSASWVTALLETKVVSGYPDGRFRPDQSLTREEAVSLLYQLSAYLQHPLPSQSPAPYSDTSGRWSSDMMAALYGAGILEKSGPFYPSKVITRGEMARYAALWSEWLQTQTVEESELQTPVEMSQGTTNTQLPSVKSEGETEEPQTDREQTPVEQPVSTPAVTEETSPVKQTLASVAQTLAEGAAPAFSDLIGREDAIYVQYLYELGAVNGTPGGAFKPDAPLARGEAAAILCRLAEISPSSPEFVPLPTYCVIEVPYISQVSPVYAPVGCEPTSLLMALKAKGYATTVTLPDFLAALPKTDSNPAKGFVGSPYRPDLSKKTRTTIYPPALTAYGQRYGKVIDLSGASTQELQRELLSGNPVVAYVTLFWEKPYYRMYNIEGTQQRLLSNNHALLLCGYNKKTHQYYVADPYNVKHPNKDYFYWVEGKLFDALYNERHHALTVE